MACLVIAQGLRMHQPSLLLPHPPRSASWSCHPRRCLSPALRLSRSRSWRSGPVCQLCLQYRWAQRWRTKGKNLCKMAKPCIHHHLRAFLKRPHYRPHRHLCHSLIPQQISLCQFKVQPLCYQIHPQHQASCLHPLGKTGLRCLPNLNQSCKYRSCPHVFVPTVYASQQQGACWREGGRLGWSSEVWWEW